MAPKILVVDDEPVIRAFVVKVLQGHGYAVAPASGADEAFGLLKNSEERIGLLLTDLNMPDRNGLDLIRDVRKARPDIPVIAMSGNLSAWVDELAGIPCIEKPFSAEKLIWEIQKAYDSRRYFSGATLRAGSSRLAKLLAEDQGVRFT